MRHFALLLSAILVLVCVPGRGLAQQPKGKPPELIAPTGPRTPAEQQKMFHLQPGFEIQLVASEPEIKKPINIAFDARGRLWVTQSEEYPFPVEAGKPSRDVLKILEDFQADGRAKKIATFADNLNVPIGVLPLGAGDETLLYSIPNIWKLTAQAGEKTPKRDPLYAKYGFADTHGMTGEFQMGFDGWVYACHGFSNTSTVAAKDGSQVTMHSGNTYRFKPDGSHIEQWTHGQVNPFGLAFDPMGNLFSCDCHSQPVMQLLRGGWYQSFGKPHDGLGFAPEMMTHGHGSTAIAGIAYYAADQFPTEFRDNVFIGNVVTNRINRDRLQRKGSTYTAVEMPDFLMCDDPWFRPVDIKLGPDGALYVADFYTKIIGHYEVPLTHPLRDNKHGRIWRIVYKGQKNNPPLYPLFDYSTFSEPRLLSTLRDSNLTARLTATHLLAGRDPNRVVGPATLLLQTSDSAVQRAHVLWVLERLGKLGDEELLAATRDGNPLVRIHLMRILAERKALTKAQHDAVLAAIYDKDAFVQRCAADALATHPDSANVRPLLVLRQLAPATDTHLVYAARAALRDQLKNPALWAVLKEQVRTDRDAGFAADVCPAVPSAEAAAYLLDHLKERPAEKQSERVRYAQHVARYGTADMVTQLVQWLADQQSGKLEARLELFKALQKGLQEGGRPVPKSGVELGGKLTASLLASANTKTVVSGMEMVGSLRLAEFEPKLLGHVANRKELVDVRRAAASALTALDAAKHTTLLAGIVANADEPLPLREHVAAALAATNQAAARDALFDALPTAPAKLETAIANGLAGSKQGAAKLLDAVAAGKASPRLLLDPSIANKLQQTKLPNLDAQIAMLTKGLPSADTRLVKLMANRRTAFVKGKPDSERGKLVFEKNCAACHQIANKGSKIGPQLDGIGIRGLDRLLEDMLDPSRNVDQAFRTTSLTMKDGKIVAGLFLREEGAVLVLADQQGKEVRVQKDMVDMRTTLQLSPMPANFGEQITVAEFVDLLGYMLELRVKK